MKAQMAPFQTGNGAHTSSYTVGTESFQKVNRPGRDVNHSHQFLAKVKERAKLFLYSSSVPSWQLVGLLFS
jgi:hypothetical protein